MIKKIYFVIVLMLFFNRIDAQTFVPIMDAGSTMFIGGFSNGEWINSEQLIRKVKGGEEYKLYSFDGYLGITTGEAPKSLGAPCPETYFINHSFKTVNENNFVTGIACDWDAFPKKLISLSTDQKIYIDITANLLKDKGIEKPNVEIIKIIKTDIENDGVDEVFINATCFKNGLSPDVLAGDYSFVYLRKIINGKVENIIIDGNYYAKASDSAIPLRFKLCNILDINNDGILEFIIFSEYYEGHEFSVYKLVNNKPVLILTASCGA